MATHSASNMKKKLSTRTEKKLNPLTLKYMKIVRVFLFSVGAWPDDEMSMRLQKLQNFLRHYFIFQTLITLIGQVIFLTERFESLSFYDLGDKILILFLTCLTVYRSAIPSLQGYKVVNKYFIRKFHLIHFKDKMESYMTINRQMDQISYYYTIFMTGIMFTGMVLFNIVPFINNVSNGVYTGNVVENYTIQFSVYTRLPGYVPEEHFTLTTIYNYILSYNCTIVICVNDLFLTLVVLQIIGHIKVLHFNLQNFPRPKSQSIINQSFGQNHNILLNPPQMYSVEENKLIHTMIADCVDHHRLIVNFTAEVSEFYGPILGLNYSFHLVACCLLLLECSQGEHGALARYGPLTIIIFFQLIQVSITFEVVGSESEKLKDAVYEMPWECMNVPNQRLVCFLLNRVQTPIHVTAMGMTTVGVDTMMKVLRATFSYFALLQSMNE